MRMDGGHESSPNVSTEEVGWPHPFTMHKECQPVEVFHVRQAELLGIFGTFGTGENTCCVLGRGKIKIGIMGTQRQPTNQPAQRPAAPVHHRERSRVSKDDDVPSPRLRGSDHSSIPATNTMQKTCQA